ncbi:MAG: metallophosphoesterase family protein [Promethearchaeota archaeon]
MIVSSRSLTESEKSTEIPVKFIHASDIHLGCQQYQNQHRADDFLKAFKEILALSIEHKVDFIILGGDVFTSLEMLPGKLLEVINLLTEFKVSTMGMIPIIAIEGNHDIRKFSFGLKLGKRGQSWLKLISSLDLIVLLDANLDADEEDVFKPYDPVSKKGGKIQIKNVVIHGVRYIGQKPVNFIPKIADSIQKKEEIFNILLQHYGIEGQMKNVPGISLEIVGKLKNRVNYLALGHFHKQFILDDWIYNPGSSEAASSIDATYKRGIFLVEIFKEEIFTKNVQIIRLNNRHHQWEVIFFPKHLKNNKEFNHFIFKKLELIFPDRDPRIQKSIDKIPVLYLVLKGKKPSHLHKINEKDLKNTIREKFPILDVKIYHKFTNSEVKLDRYM